MGQRQINKKCIACSLLNFYFQSQDLPNLVELHLSRNGLDNNDLTDGCFSSVGSTLLELFLNENDFTEIRSNLLSGLTVLTDLHLHANQINNIQPGKLS